MSVTEPPAYATVTRLVQEAKAFVATEPKQPAEVPNQLQAILETPEIQKKIAADIQTLSDTTMDVRATFENVVNVLGIFDSHKYMAADSTAIPPQQPAWIACKSAYSQLIDDSHQDAVIIKKVCDDYAIKIQAGFLAPEAEVGIADMKIIAEGFLSSIEAAQNKASLEVKKFDALREQVILLNASTQKAVASASTDPGDKIGTLNSQITALQKTLADLNSKLSHLQTAFWSVTAGTTIVGIIAAVCPLTAPFLAPVAAVGTAACAYISKQMDDVSGEIEANTKDLTQKQAELADLKEQQQELRDLQSQAKDLAGPVGRIVSQLGGLTNFWESVKAEVTEIRAHLESATKDKTKFEVRQDLGVTATGHFFQVLGNAMGLYAAQLVKTKK